MNTSAEKVNMQKKNGNTVNFQAGFELHSLIKKLLVARSAKNSKFQNSKFKRMKNGESSVSGCSIDNDIK